MKYYCPTCKGWHHSFWYVTVCRRYKKGALT